MSNLMDSAAGKGRNLSTNFWIWLLIGSLVVFAGNTLYATTKASRLGGASSAASRLQLNSQRLANQGREAIDGNVQAFEAFKATKEEIDGDIKWLNDRFGDAADVAAPIRTVTETWNPLTKRAADSGLAQPALVGGIEMERELLAGLREVSTVIDTSELRPAVLRSWIRDLVGARPGALTLVFESFAFKHGVPLDADFVFDVRVLPNPYYIRELRPLSGRDAPVADYLRAQPEATDMLEQIEAFLRRWLPAFEDDQRSYLTVAIGCTGGQHRSGYLVESLAQRFASHGAVLRPHPELDSAA